MTAAPLNNGLAKVRKLLPVRIEKHDRDVSLYDKNGREFCFINGFGRDDAMARAELIRDAMNEME